MKRTFNAVKRGGQWCVDHASTLGTGTALTLLGQSAYAAVPVAVTTAITDAGLDAVSVASAVLVVIVGIFAVKLMRKGL